MTHTITLAQRKQIETADQNFYGYTTKQTGFLPKNVIHVLQNDALTDQEAYDTIYGFLNRVRSEVHNPHAPLTAQFLRIAGRTNFTATSRV